MDTVINIINSPIPPEIGKPFAFVLAVLIVWQIIRAWNNRPQEKVD